MNTFLRTAVKERAALSLLVGKRHAHTMLGLLIAVANASEMARALQHIKLVHVAIALPLFAIWLATKVREEEIP